MCGLPPSALPERMARWKALTAQTITKASKSGVVTSTYPNKDEILSELRELIALEGDCCSFLAFEVKRLEDVIEVELRYPPGFEEMIAGVVGEPV